MIKIYIINLKRRPEKREYMEKQLEKQGIPLTAVEFIDAVDGNNLTEEQLNSMNIRVHPWFDPYSKRAITKGEIGCALSHVLVWNKIKESGNAGIVLEDDAELCDNFLATLMERLIKISHQYDFMYLGRKKMGKDTPLENQEAVIAGMSYWTVGYLLKPDGATKLLENDYTSRIIPVDEYLPACYNAQKFADYEIQNNMVALALTPPIVKPFSGAFSTSDTEQSDSLDMTSSIINKQEHAIKVHVVAVASDETEGWERCKNSLETMGYEYSVIGMGREWKTNMRKGEGGGQKILWLREFLNSCELPDDTYIVHTDAYDTIWQRPHQEFVREWDKYVKETGKHVLFGAEKTCWPDKAKADSYPNTKSDYKYLNSGLYIARLDILKTLLEAEIKEKGDDQRYFTELFFNSDDKIGLDYNQRFFWNISDAYGDFTINYDKSQLTVDSSEAVPYAIHGNGPDRAKALFNRICDYIPNIFRPTYGSKYLKNLVELPEDDDLLPTVMIYSPNGIFPSFDYPKSKLFLVSNIVDRDTISDIDEYRAIIDMNLGDMKPHTLYANTVKLAKKFGVDYYLTWQAKQTVRDSGLIKSLLQHGDKFRIMSYLMKSGGTLYSSFWGELDSKGYYRRSFDYIKLVEANWKGIWNVPYVNQNFFFRNADFDFMINGYKSEVHNDSDMSICKYLRDHGVGIYMDNRKIYGNA
jgi:GR25 family glycosyltransferase involved in LPS biosynthesis